MILSEVNVKELEYLKDSELVLVKNIKANFKKLGPKFGKQMKGAAAAIAQMDQADIAALEKAGTFGIQIDGESHEISLDEVEIQTQDIPGWLVANDGPVTVALDITLSQELKEEGIAREVVNRIQNIRKDSGLEVTDKIKIKILKLESLQQAVENNFDYICSETLTGDLEWVDTISDGVSIEIEEDLTTKIEIQKLN